MIRLQHIDAKVRGNTLFQAEDLRFTKGSITALLGKNGSGKSTLLKAIAGLDSLVQGTILLEDKRFHLQKSYFPSPLVSYIPVKIQTFGSITLMDFVLSGRSEQRGFFDIPSAVEQKDVLLLLQQFNMQQMAEDAFENLSDGEQKMALIMRSMHRNAQILLLDEPESFLDVGNRKKVFELLKNLANEGKTIIFSTHQPDLAANYVNNFLAIHDQEIRQHPVGDYNELIHYLFN
jgi:iron complex transport system ATP-binding protein